MNFSQFSRELSLKLGATREKTSPLSVSLEQLSLSSASL